MNTRTILSQLHTERDRITRAIEVLESLGSAGQRTPVRRRRRPMSRAARKRIALAKKQWWAKRKRQE